MEDQIATLRATLNELSLQADELQQSELSDHYFASQFDDTISSWTTPDTGTDILGTASRGNSGTSDSSNYARTSPLRFLQMALPDVTTSRLKQALETSEDEEADLWEIVATILSEESIREMEERGLDGLDEEADYTNFDEDEVDWETVQVKKKTPVRSGKKKKTQPRPMKVALADIRQQHHVQKGVHCRNGSTGSITAASPAADPWVRLSSLSARLSSLLPPHPPTTFSSFFHSADYPTSYDALRAALSSISKTSPEEIDGHTTVLFHILDIVMPEYENVNADKRYRVISDVQLAVAVTDGRGDDSLDIVSLLRDLDSDPNMGLNHLPAPPPSSPDLPSSPNRGKTPQLSLWTQRQSGPPDIPQPRIASRSPQTPNKPNPFQWQVIPERKVAARGPHPLVHQIPAYSRDVNGIKTERASTPRTGNSTYDSSEFRQQITKARARMHSALMNAAIMYQKGNSKNRGGDVALYYAEEVCLCYTRT